MILHWYHYFVIFTISASVVTYEQLKAMLANHSVQLFDVRNPDEFQAGRIPNSINIPCESSLKCIESVFLFSQCALTLGFNVSLSGTA